MGVGGGEADVRDGESWQILDAERQIFFLVKDLRGSLEMRGGGKKLTAQQPKRTRWFHGLRGFGGVDSIVLAIMRITLSESLSS